MRKIFVVIAALLFVAAFASASRAHPAKVQLHAENAYSRAEPLPVVASVKSVVSAGQAQDRLQALESLYGATITPSSENAAELTSVIAHGSSKAERVAAIRLYASLHAPSNSPSFNADVQGTLRQLAQSSEREIATAALLRYSRLPFSADTEMLLDLNFSRGFLDKNDLLGELAHIFPFAPEADQIRFLERIDKGGSEYALDVLTSNMKSRTMRTTLLPTVRKRLETTLEAHQPKFALPIGEFSLKEAIVYSDWLHTLASIKSENSRASYESIVLSHLGSHTANPKKIVSFFASPEGKSTASKLGNRRLKAIFQRVELYSKALPYPQHSALKDLALSTLALQHQIGQ